MAKIDTTTIEGYSAMSESEKLAALEAYDFDDGASEIERYKSAASKANTEAADWKRKHNELLANAGKAKETETENEQLRTRVEQLEKQNKVATYTANYTALGYDKALAAETAQALADGDMAKVLENQKKYQDAHEKALLANKMKNFPTPPAGDKGEPDDGYLKKAAEAQANGDFSAAAYYTRLAHESKTS